MHVELMLAPATCDLRVTCDSASNRSGHSFGADVRVFVRNFVQLDVFRENCWRNEKD